MLSLLPYQFNEIPNTAKEESLFKGCYPELINKNFALFYDWYSSYLDTYLQKDVNALAHIGDKREFRLLLRLLAGQTAQILNYASYAKDIGVDVKTIKRWISVLEASYIIFLLPPFYENFGKRIVKSPKVYFYDTGLVSFLTGIETQNQFLQGPLAGHLFENYVISQIYKNQSHRKKHSELFYFRSQDGMEVDLIIDKKTSHEFIEIKLNSTFNRRWLKPMESLIRPQDKGYLVYTGEVQPYSDPISIVPYSEFLEQLD